MLTESRVRTAKPLPKAYKLTDGKGLHLLVTPQGARLWRFRYRVSGVEKMISLGAYDDVSLKQARDRRDEARRQVAAKIDPSSKRKAERAAAADTFKAVAEEWLELNGKSLAEITRTKAQWQLRFLYEKLGSEPIGTIKPAQILAALRKIEVLGRNETAHRVKQRCGQIFRFAVATGRAERDVTADLRGALAPVNSENHPAVTDPAGVGALLRAIDGYTGQPTTRAALRLAPLVFVRPGELRAAEWSEFDFDASMWRIPAERMKMKDAHVVPLSTQAVAILKPLKSVTGAGKLVFPAITHRDRPLSENTLNAALRRIGYSQDQMTAHGFRTIASTLLNELGFAPDLIELQLAHKERNKSRASYNRAQQVEKRTTMMREWADHLDKLRASVK